MPKKIIIVEDERPMANALVLKLSNSGFETEVVFDGKEAMAKLKKNKYDLMLLDLMMPRMGGFEVLESLKKSGNKMPVIISTNLSQESDIKKAKTLGAVDYFVKSDTSISKVVEQIKKFLKV